MPARSAARQKAAGAALPARRGDPPRSRLRGAAPVMFESMTEPELEEPACPRVRGSRSIRIRIDRPVPVDSSGWPVASEARPP